jgi:hypothetical protein
MAPCLVTDLVVTLRELALDVKSCDRAAALRESLLDDPAGDLVSLEGCAGGRPA